MKRMRMSEGGLTGGTGDVNPQLLSFTAVQSGADTTTTTTQNLPIQRLPTGGRAQVLELLRAYVELSALPASASATETTDSILVNLSTTSFGTTTASFSDPRVVFKVLRASRSAFTAAGTYFAYDLQSPIMIDLTDGAGHGILIATDSIFAQVASTATGNTNTANIKLLYRWKNVGLQEYVGLVQSQQ